MAFEVARVHGLICSSIGDQSGFNSFRTATHAFDSDQTSSRLCTSEGAQHCKNYTELLPCNLGVYDQRSETASLPLESSSCSTETESDDEDDLFEGLAQQIAHSMLDEEETATDKCTAVGNRKGCWETRGLPNELSEVSLSPSSWSSGSWLSSPLLSGSRSSSKGSSNVSSQVSSPSSTPSSGYLDAWETLYAAAGEVVRLKMNEEKMAAILSAERPPHSKVVNQALRAHLPLQARPSGQLSGRSPPSYPARRKEELAMVGNQVQQNWASKCPANTASTIQERRHSIQYPQHHQAYTSDGQQGFKSSHQSGKLAEFSPVQRNRNVALNGRSGVRVVFLGAAAGRESGGTGVFLPRSLGNAFEQKKKHELPATIAPMRGYVMGVPCIESPKSTREAFWPTLQQSINRPNLWQPVGHEPRLPSEWTY